MNSQMGVQHKYSLVIYACSVIAMATHSFPIAANDRAMESKIADLEMRIEILESILHQRPSTTATNKPQRELRLPTSSYKQGWRMDMFIDEEMSENKLTSSASGFNVGSVSYTKVPKFNFNAIKKHSDLKKYSKENYGLLWSGQIRIPSTGKHLFAVDIENIGGGVNGSGPCKASLTLGRDAILQVDGKFEFHTTGIFATKMTEKKVERGTYDASLWLVCYISSNNSDLDNGAVVATIKSRGPNDRTLADMPSNYFVLGYGN